MAFALSKARAAAAITRADRPVLSKVCLNDRRGERVRRPPPPSLLLPSP
jgi:hypothetical protein